MELLLKYAFQSFYSFNVLLRFDPNNDINVPLSLFFPDKV